MLRRSKAKETPAEDARSEVDSGTSSEDGRRVTSTDLNIDHIDEGDQRGTKSIDRASEDSEASSSHSLMRNFKRALTSHSLVPPVSETGSKLFARTKSLMEGARTRKSSREDKENDTSSAILADVETSTTVSSEDIRLSSSEMVKVLIQNLAQKEEELVKLRQEKRAAEEKLDEKEQRVLELQEKITGLEGQNAKNKELLQNRTREVDLERKLKRLSQMYHGVEKSTEREVASLKFQMEEQMVKLEGEKLKFVQELSQRDSAAKSLVEERKQLEERCREIEKILAVTDERLRVAQIEYTKATGDLKDRERELAESTRRIIELNTDLNHRNMELSKMKELEGDLHVEVRKLDLDNRNIQSQLSEEQRSSEYLREKLKTADDRIQKYETESDRLNDETRKLTSESLRLASAVAELERHKESLKMQINEKNREIEKLTLEMQQQWTVLNSTKNGVSVGKEIEQRLRLELETLKREYSQDRLSFQEELDRNLEKIASLEIEGELLKKDNIRLESKIKDLEEDKDHLENNLREALERASKNAALLEMAEAEAIQTEKTMSSLKESVKKIDPLECQLELLEAELRESRSRGEDARKKIRSLELEISSSKSELQSASNRASQVDEAMKRQEELQNEMLQMESEITHYESEVARYKREATQKTEEVRRISIKLSQVEKESKCMERQLEEANQEFVNARCSFTERESALERSVQDKALLIIQLEKDKDVGKQYLDEVAELKGRIKGVVKERDELLNELEKVQEADSDKSARLANARLTIDSLKYDHRKLATSLANAKEELRKMALAQSREERTRQPRWALPVSGAAGLVLGFVVRAVSSKKASQE
eukprot:CAMPEP_0184689888 /NCGR_PEP_ID=MMETSP0312-20130426/30907_1 /TAXON_ID=31354 /ORGANISM="Compsopogon coeruleus, Strain SAG 36.94" /LENGTH=835 /DNA_ID=CAMNT_0027147293 /DNA_START=807 /DNA_END=3314 /DNA_ORIENTATION=-